MLPGIVLDAFLFVSIIQNLEPSVEFDTVANKKQQHEINVGKNFCIPVLFILLTSYGHRGKEKENGKVKYLMAYNS